MTETYRSIREGCGAENTRIKEELQQFYRCRVPDIRVQRAGAEILRVAGSLRAAASIMACSVSTSITSENGFRIRRVFGRTCSSCPDPSGTAEKMMIGIGGGMATTTSRPEPC